jgi:PAS domain S-box-containing protein
VLLNSRTTRLLLEAADGVGIPRGDILDPLGLTERELVDPKARVEWTTVTLLLGQVARLVDGDVERLRDVGRHMLVVPSYDPLRRVARGVLSCRTMYDMAIGWIAAANFPHLPLSARHTGERRLRFQGEIPPSYAPSEVFMRVFEGSITELPTLLGLPPSRILESTVTPRSVDLLIELPPERTLLGRLRRGVRTVLDAPDAVRVLEQQRAELAESIEELQRARDEIRVLLDRLPDLVAVHVEGAIVWANRAFVKTLGYERLDEVVGTPLLDRVAPHSRASVAERMRQAPDAPNVPALSEFTLRSRTGAEVTVEVAPTQAVVFEGRPARLVVGRDVTERSRMQQKLLVADRLASVGLLAAGIAHEVNNPLAYVLNNIEMAHRELGAPGADLDMARRVLSVALEGVDRIRVIVRDLLKLSRGDDGNEASVGAVDVTAVARSTLALAAQEIERTAELVQDYRPVPLVTASEPRIAQVLLNLVGNALEAMGGRPREQNRLVVRLSRTSDGRVLLEVSDTGRGIPDFDLSRLFEPFFTTKPAGHGTGLGLAIAQRLVVEIGGEITVSSVLGRGTTFRVLLPAVVTGTYAVLPTEDGPRLR